MRFTNVTVDWYISTFLLYLSIILACYVIPRVTRNTVLKLNGSIKLSTGVVAVAVILLFFKCFNTTGRDLREGYYLNFLSATSLNNYRDQSIEIGFRVLTVLVRCLTKDYGVFLFVVGLITVLPVIYVAEKRYRMLDLSTCFLLYSSVFYFATFSAIRSTLAAAIGVAAFDAMLDKKPTRALLFIGVASLFHVTALALLLPFFFVFLRVLTRREIYFTLLSAFLLIVLGRRSIGQFMATSERYYVYQAADKISFGLEQFVYYVPLFMLYYYGKKRDSNSVMTRVSFSYLSVAFCFGMMGYVVPIFGRMQSLFVPIIFIAGYYAKRVFSMYSNKKIVKLAIIGYCIARFVIFIGQYYCLEDTMPYTNIFGWIV